MFTDTAPGRLENREQKIHRLSKGYRQFFVKFSTTGMIRETS